LSALMADRHVVRANGPAGVWGWLAPASSASGGRLKGPELSSAEYVNA
jgi:hypothetical protein